MKKIYICPIVRRVTMDNEIVEWCATINEEVVCTKGFKSQVEAHVKSVYPYYKIEDGNAVELESYIPPIF